MAITDAQIQKLKEMCPVAGDVDLGALIRAAEAGGLEGDDTTIAIADGEIGVKAGGIDTTQLADGAVTAAKLDAGIALVENPLAGPAAGERVFRGQVALAGGNPTHVDFNSAPNAATLLGSVEGPFNLTVGNTIIVNPNGAGDHTWTVAGTAGKSAGATDPSTDMSAVARHHLRIAVDGGAAQDVGFDWTAGGGCNTGAKIAAEMQAKIRALGGAFAAVSVAYDTNHYDVTSGTLGTASRVVITAAADDDCTEELKLGVPGGGTETAGTGDAANLAAATAAEVAAKIAALDPALAPTAADGSKVRLTATNTGGTSSLVLGNGTENATLGFTNGQSDYGDVGLGLAGEMADATYTVMLTPITNAPGTPDVISAYNKTTAGFDIYQETPTQGLLVDVLVIGAPAA